MVKKIRLIFLLSLTLLLILGTTSFANVTMTEEIADAILDYFSENLETCNSSVFNSSDIADGKQKINTTNRLEFANYFNTYFTSEINYNGDYSWDNISILGFYGKSSTYPGIRFILSNNTFGSNDLNYLYLKQGSNYVSFSGYDGSNQINNTVSYFQINLRGGSAFQKTKGTLSTTNSFYQNTQPTIEGEQINYKSLLALSPSQVIYYMPYNGTTANSYFLKNYYDADPSVPEIPDDTESGDVGESGDTGGGTGGDTGGGTTTPDYSDDLDNIQTGIGNIENAIVSGNQEIVGEIGEVKDFLSGDATLTENELLEKFPEVEIDDPSEDFFSWIFSQIENVFLSTEPQTFEFSLFTENKYSVSSEQIKVPDNAIKTLVGLSTAFGIFYWILKDVRKTINKVKEGSIEALATEDITADMV